jgi:hypothetical protein
VASKNEGAQGFSARCVGTPDYAERRSKPRALDRLVSSSAVGHRVDHRFKDMINYSVTAGPRERALFDGLKSRTNGSWV